MHIKKVTKKDRYGNQVTTEYEVPEKSIDPTRLMEKRMELDQPDMEITMMSMPVGGEEFNMGDPNNHPGEPMGQDTVPAWLTPGEFVVNAEAMAVPELAAQVEDINNAGRMMKEGGMVPQQHHRMPGGTLMAGEYHNVGGIIGDDAMDFAGPEELTPAQIQERMAAMRAASPGGESVPIPVAAPWTQKPAGLDDLLHEREGFREDVYLDTLGKPTVGYGHLLPEEYKAQVGETPFSQDQLTAWFDEDVRKAQEGAVENIGRETFTNLTPEQQRAVTSMAFQLGKGGQAKFEKMIKAIKAGDHKAAAREALTGSKGGKSKWYKQTPKRAMDLAMAFDPDTAAQYKNAGGVVYASDGGWGSWLKSAANKYVLGPKNQFDIPVVDQDPTADLSGGWTPPITNSDLQQAEVWERQYAGRDPDDLGMVTPPAPAVEEPGIMETIFPKWNDPYATIAGDLGDKIFTEEDFGEGSEADERDQIAARAAESEEYISMMDRAAAAGRIPPTPEEWLEANQRDESGQSQMDRFAPYSETVGQTAAAEVIAEGGTAEEADEAAAKADEALAAGATEEEAIEAGKEPPTFAEIQEQDADDQPAVDVMTPEGEADINKVIQNANSDERKKVQDEAKSLFAELGLDSLFDKKELARMAVMYAGSRLLGHSHHGSLNWAAKNYINRVDAKEEGYSKLALSGKYTPESLKKFKKSGDYGDLMPVGVTPEATGEFKTFYGPGGKQQRAEKFKVGEQSVWQTADGRRVTSDWSEDAGSVPGTREYGDRIKADAGQYTNMVEDLRKTFGTTPGGRDQPDTYATDLAPSVAGGKIAKWAADNKVPPEYMGQIVENAYHSAVQHSRDTGEKVRDLTPFLEEQYVVSQVGDSSLFQGISGTNVTKLMDGVVNAYGGKYSKAQAMQVYRNAWNKLTDEQKAQYDAKAGKERNGFMVFVEQDIQAKLTGG